jgi:hypothetical protein
MKLGRDLALTCEREHRLRGPRNPTFDLGSADF